MVRQGGSTLPLTLNLPPSRALSRSLSMSAPRRSPIDTVTRLCTIASAPSRSHGCTWSRWGRKTATSPCPASRVQGRRTRPAGAEGRGTTCISLKRSCVCGECPSHAPTSGSCCMCFPLRATVQARRRQKGFIPVLQAACVPGQRAQIKLRKVGTIGGGCRGASVVGVQAVAQAMLLLRVAQDVRSVRTP